MRPLARQSIAAPLTDYCTFTDTIVVDFESSHGVYRTLKTFKWVVQDSNLWPWA